MNQKIEDNLLRIPLEMRGIARLYWELEDNTWYYNLPRKKKKVIQKKYYGNNKIKISKS